MQKVLFIGVHWPEPSTAAATRIMQLIRTFLANDYHISFASTAAESELSYTLELLQVSKVHISLNHSSFDNFIRELEPNIVIYDRFLTEEQFGWRVAENVPNALRILDTEDLHSLRMVRLELFKKGIAFSTDKWLAEECTKREIASIYRCDLSLIISSFEMQLLKDTLKMDDSLLLHLPFMMEKVSKNEFNTYPTFEERKDFICIGNGKHAPNIDAVVWLKNTIWPLIRKQLPECKLHVYGSYLPQQIVQMHKPQEGFYVEGYTKNLKRVFTEARINLAPLRFGAGLKGKLIDGMRFGTPNITTDIGVEGMTDGLPFNGAVANNENDFANHAVAFYNSKDRFILAQENGLEILKQVYDLKRLSEKLIHRITEIQSTIEKHRTTNFMGSMLRYHSIRSSKYLSKWIEAKNALGK